MNGSRPAGVCAILDPAPTPAPTPVPAPTPASAGRAVLHLRGPLEADAFHRAVHRIAESHPGRRLPAPRLLRHGPGRHTVELPAHPPPPGTQAPYPLGLLADLLTAGPPAPAPAPAPGRPAAGGRHCGTLPRTLTLTPLMRERLAGALLHPGHHVEQLAWRWHGPLDAARFTAAWQAVTDRESVLRTAFVWDPSPRAVVFDQGTPEVRRRSCDSAADRAAAGAAERAGGFDLRRPGPLRVALLEGGPGRTEVLITYHRALLDSWSVRLLMQECCRAYLGGGLPGGERRPDLGDCTRWLHGQDRAPARLHPPAPLPPALPHPAAGGAAGVHRTALTRAESLRLARWAARWDATESSVLQAVWALVTYRALAAAPAPRAVGFGLAFPGRGLLLEGVERTPGPFENTLPMTVALHPRRPLAGVLRELRDRALEMAAYEWAAPAPAPAAGAAEGTGTVAGAGTLLAFDYGPRPQSSLTAALAGHGVRVERQDLVGALTGYALTLRAGPDARHGLALTCTYDPALAGAEAARTMLAQAAHLLRLLPCTARGPLTVADALALLTGAALPRMPRPASPRPPAGPAGPGVLVPLRPAARPGAGTVCVVDAPGAPPPAHRELLRHCQGPQALSVLRAGGGEAALTAAAHALAAAARSGPRLVLAGYSGAGALACELAARLAAHGARTPLVVISGGTDHDTAARTLAHALHETAP
ncbi:condensation domain-containing protein [Streptomyces sp. NPDC005423]|uniref:condensation domain-containing protein n=1 Tax=Streptomyces sp. NPDC005423 TaxID=3155343 RepID=UPI0033BEA7F1